MDIYQRRVHTSVSDTNLGASRAAAGVLDAPPHIVSLDDGESLQSELLTDPLTVGVLQASGHVSAIPAVRKDDEGTKRGTGAIQCCWEIKRLD